MNLHPRLNSGDALMVVAAVWSVSRGIGYLPMFSPEKLAGPLAMLTMDSQGALTMLAFAWIAAAGMCVVGILRRKAVWIIGVISMCVMWAATFWIAWVLSWLWLDSRSDWVMFWALAVGWCVAMCLAAVGWRRHRAIWVAGLVIMALVTFGVGLGMSWAQPGPTSRDWYSGANYAAALLGLALWLADRQRKTRRADRREAERDT